MKVKKQINRSGRIVVPAKLRKALGIQAGDEIVMRLENGSMRLIPRRQAIKLAQKIVRRYVPKGVSLVDELIMARKWKGNNFSDDCQRHGYCLEK